MSGQHRGIVLFRKLLKKFLAGTSLHKEEEVLDHFFNAMQHNGISSEEVRHDLALRNRILEGIQRKRSAHRQYRFGVRLAASVVGILVTASVFYLAFHSGTPDLIVVQTERGQQMEVWLPDSSKVILNADSKLSYQQEFTAATRNITLEGEAYFEVTHDDQKPFIVSTRTLTTRVLGTRFSVTGYANEEAAVTVVAGKVKVMDTRQRFVYLTANERVMEDFSGRGLFKHYVDADKYISWTTGKVFFDQLDMQQVISILNKRYDAHLRLPSADYDKTCTLSGNFSGATLDHVLESIAFIYDIKYERDPNSDAITIYIKPCSTKQ